MSVARVVAALERDGLLLVQDKLWPCVATIFAGAPIAGSWWGHAQGNAIFEALNALEDRGDVLFAKLVHKKVTLVHARLWPALVAVARGRQPWQVGGLTGAADALLSRVDAGEKVRASGAAVRLLEERLLVVAQQVHTASGKHETELSGWAGFAASRAVASVPRTEGERVLTEAVEAINAAAGAKLRLPWPSG